MRTEARLPMHIFPRDRVGLFIDGPSLSAASRALGFDIDFKRLLALFRQQGELRRAHFYTALTEDERSSSVRPLIDWLDYNGYTTVTKLVKPRDVDGGQIRGSVDIELAVDAMRLANCIDHIVLFSGSGQLRGLVAALQEQGKRVTVISTLSTKTVGVADELRRQADQFVDLVDLQDQIGQSHARGLRSAR
jgi:uncharacterized LabA/DUF88 family protein